jgi:long-chain acyl-CoA synthetase
MNMERVDEQMKSVRPSVAGLIKKRASEQPDKLALVAGEAVLTYGELFRKIRSAAAFLKTLGVGKGTHVVSMAVPAAEYVVIEYAILGLGAVHIPAENRAPGDRLAEIAKAVDATLIISPEKPSGEIAWVRTFDVPMDDAGDPDWEPAPVSDDCNEIIFTTGTTGKSKGVMLSSHCLEVYLEAMNPSFRLTEDSVFLVTTPLNHVGGLHRVHQCMAAGSLAILMDGVQNLRAFFRYIDQYGVTHTYLPPASVKMILTLAKKQLAALNGKLQFIYTASAPFPTKDIETLMELLPDTRLHQGYGSSETGSISNCRYNAPGEKPNCLGEPYPCVEVQLLDEQGNEITEPYKEGLICSKSGMNMLGYYNEPELTAGILRDGYIYSKDLMYFDDRHRLFFAGRSDDVVNIRGFKVAPTEVEDVLLRYEKVADCACIPHDDPRLGKSLRMFVVMKEGETFDSADIAHFLETKLEAYKVPRTIEQIEEIPKTYNGKVDRKKLIAM